MKNLSGFVILTVSTLLIIFLYIWHYNATIRYVYRKQRSEKELDDLTKEKARLTNSLLTVQNPHDIKKRAEAMGMRPIPLTQIHRSNLKK